MSSVATSQPSLSVIDSYMWRGSTGSPVLCAKCIKVWAFRNSQWILPSANDVT